jgi:hypothetical protein
MPNILKHARASRTAAEPPEKLIYADEGCRPAGSETAHFLGS